MTKQRRRRIPGDVEDAIVLRALQGWSPAQIAEALDQDPTLRDRRPSERTIRRIVAELRTDDDASGTWTLATAEPGTVRLLLDVLEDTIACTEQIVTFTHAQAALIVRIADAVGVLRPDGMTAAARLEAHLFPFDVWLFARYYEVAERVGWRTAALDLYLAARPWVSEYHARTYAIICPPELRFTPPVPPGTWRGADDPDSAQALALVQDEGSAT